MEQHIKQKHIIELSVSSSNDFSLDDRSNLINKANMAKTKIDHCAANTTMYESCKMITAIAAITTYLLRRSLNPQTPMLAPTSSSIHRFQTSRINLGHIS
jgi:hypothetical protein